jgi:hypothetical protein
VAGAPQSPAGAGRVRWPLQPGSHYVARRVAPFGQQEPKLVHRFAEVSRIDQLMVSGIDDVLQSAELGVDVIRGDQHWVPFVERDRECFGVTLIHG